MDFAFRRCGTPLAIGLLLCLALSGQTLAQTVPTPGSLLQDLQQKTMPSELLPNPEKPTPAAPVEGEPVLPPASFEQGQETVFIREIHLEGASLLSPIRTRMIIEPFENRNLTFDQLRSLAARLTAMYREKGYVTSRVYIPAQNMQDGVLILKALEGQVGKITIQEGKFFKRRSVLPYISLDSGEPFNVKILKRELRQLNQNPDRTMGAVLKPGVNLGETDLELDVHDALPVHLTPSFDNLGRRLIGENRFGLQMTHSNLLGYGDQALTSLSFTRKSFGVVNHYELPVSAHGTTIGFDHAYSRLRLGKEFEDLDVQGRAVTYSPFISQQLLSRKNTSASVDLAFDFKELDTDILGLDFAHDSLRVLRPGLSLEHFDRQGRTFIRQEFDIGLDVLGGTTGSETLASRDGAGTKFFNYTGALIRTQKLPFSSVGIFRVLGQASPDRLVSSQQFQLGGAFTVRGYPEGQAIGDKGFLTSAELRMPFFLIPPKWTIPGTPYNLRRNIQFVTFTDYGAAYTNRPLPGSQPHTYLLGLGLGLRVQLTRHLIARVDWGFPVLNRPENQGARLHFGLQSNLF